MFGLHLGEDVGEVGQSAEHERIDDVVLAPVVAVETAGEQAPQANERGGIVRRVAESLGRGVQAGGLAA